MEQIIHAIITMVLLLIKKPRGLERLGKALRKSLTPVDQQRLGFTMTKSEWIVTLTFISSEGKFMKIHFIKFMRVLFQRDLRTTKEVADALQAQGVCQVLLSFDSYEEMNRALDELEVMLDANKPSLNFFENHDPSLLAYKARHQISLYECAQRLCVEFDRDSTLGCITKAANRHRQIRGS